MKFKVIKSSFDGICGGESRFDSIDEVLREVAYSKGWISQAEMHEAIRKWAKQCRAGDVFCTHVTAIVAVGPSRPDRVEDECPNCLHKGLEYGEIDGTEDGDLEQLVSCPSCCRRWVDTFTLSDQRVLKEGDR